MLEQIRRRVMRRPIRGKGRSDERFPDYPDFRYNYLLGIVNGVLFYNGLSFFSRTTIIPLFMTALGSPGILISLASLFEVIGWHLPQFFASKFVVHRSLKLPLYRASAIVRVAGLLMVVLSAYLAGTIPHALALTLFMLGFCSFGIAGGFAGLVFTEVLAKTVPKQKRGSYFGWRAILSGAASLLVALLVVKPLFARYPFPTSFMISFSIGVVLISISLYLFMRQKEPPQDNLPPHRTMRMHFAKAGRILRNDPQFRRLVIFRSLLMLWYAGIPYYFLFATERLGFEKDVLGLFMSWESAGAMVASILWGYLSNRIGNKSLLVLVCGFAVVVSGALLLFHLSALPLWLFSGIFFLSAAVDNGAGTGGINYALEIVPEGERPTYVGIMHSLLATSLLLATLGGVVRDVIGYQGLFILTGVIAVASFIMILRMPEPRHTVHIVHVE